MGFRQFRAESFESFRIPGLASSIAALAFKRFCWVYFAGRNISNSIPWAYGVLSILFLQPNVTRPNLIPPIKVPTVASFVGGRC